LISLLTTSEHDAVSVVGDVQLHSIPNPQSRLILPGNHGRSPTIELSVRVYAYGQYDDGTVALWAAGRVDWFTIKPSRAYRKIYDRMIEAIELLYWIADAYREERTNRKG
jgi:hypothetical protein